MTKSRTTYTKTFRDAPGDDGLTLRIGALETSRPYDPELRGYVHSVESAGAVDGPGVRFIVFLTGCPLRCQYCHNPDCIKSKNGQFRTVQDILDELKSVTPFLKKAGGGVTISGGEPLAQPDFTLALLRGARRMGLHTALDTSGYMIDHASDEILAATDLVLLDVKAGLPDLYQEVTGVPLQPTLRFARHLSLSGKPMWVRFVLVPGLTDSLSNLKALALILSTYENIERMDILPFHKMGEYKWEMMDMEYKLKETPEPTAEQVLRAKEFFTAYGLPVM